MSIETTPLEDLMNPEGALARWQKNLKRYANQIRLDYPTAAVTISLVCREMETARKALKRNQARKHRLRIRPFS